MTVDENNEMLMNFCCKKNKDNSWILNDRFQQILKLKTTKILPKINENLSLLMVIVEKISSIKDICIGTQFSENKCYVTLYYKSEEIEGEIRNSKFSTSREKPIDKYNQALFEVCCNFIGWLNKDLKYKNEIEYELDHVVSDESGHNIIYMKIHELTCPYCHSTFNIEDNFENNDEKK